MFFTVFCYVTLTGNESVITKSQLPDGNESVHHLHVMEEQIRRDRIPKERIEEGPEPGAPVFDLMPEMVQVRVWVFFFTILGYFIYDIVF